MVKKKRLNKRQLAVIDDLVGGELDEQTVLDKHGVSRNVYNKWVVDEGFANEFDLRVAWLARQSELIIARYACVAAVKLVQLIESEKAETARKVCRDIISLPKPSGRKGQVGSKTVKSSDGDRRVQVSQMSPQLASRLLAALAEKKGGYGKA